MTDLETAGPNSSHVVFTYPLDASSRKQVQVSDRVATVYEMSVEFVPLGMYGGSLFQPMDRTPPMLASDDEDVMSVDAGQLQEDTNLLHMSRSIVSALLTAGWTPNHIRHMKSDVCRRLATMVDYELDTLSRADDVLGGQTVEHDCTVLILSRALDVITPMMLDFSYQSLLTRLAYDDEAMAALPASITDFLHQVHQSSDDELETDELWQHIRQLHLHDALRVCGERERKLSASQEQEQVRLTLHLQLLALCQRLVDQQELQEVLSVQQLLVTGLDEHLGVADDVLGSDQEADALETALMLSSITSIAAVADGDDEDGSTGGRHIQQTRQAIKAAVRGLQTLIDTERDGQHHSVKLMRDRYQRHAECHSHLPNERYLPLLPAVIEALAQGRLVDEDGQWFPSVRQRRPGLVHQRGQGALGHLGPGRGGGASSASSKGGAGESVRVRGALQSLGHLWSSSLHRDPVPQRPGPVDQGPEAKSDTPHAPTLPTLEQNLLNARRQQHHRQSRPCQSTLVFMLGGLSPWEVRSAQDAARSCGTSLLLGTSRLWKHCPDEYVQWLRTASTHAGR